MIEKYRNLIGKQVIAVTSSYGKIKGIWSDWLSEDSSEASILIDKENGEIIELYETEILEIIEVN